MKQLTGFVLCIFSALPAAALSDTLLIDAVNAEQKSDVNRPQRMDSMDMVEQTFGAPEKKHAPVGTPPISSWEYPQFTVYYEFDKVITTVLSHQATPDK